MICHITVGMETITSVKERLSTPANVALITDWLARNKGAKRTPLARDTCEQLGLRDGKGELQISSALKALRDLEKEGYWELPAARTQKKWQWTPRRLGYEVALPQGVPARVEQIVGLELIEVRASHGEHMRIWNELMLTEHPLHDCRMVGRQLRYLIGSAHGWLGGIGFGSSALYLESRDQWIGWDESQRSQYHERVINMTRYLIRPSVKSDNVASHILGLCSRRVGMDFQARYGIEPWMMETFIDREQYVGTCYQAANWTCVGQTKGRGRNGSKKEGKSIKDVYLYPLVSNFRARMGLRKTESVEPQALEKGLESDQWAQQEFGGCQLGDGRLTAQLVRIAQDKGRQPSGSYSRACGGNRHQLKSYYRLMNNERDEVSCDTLAAGHREQTIRRIASEKEVLIIQDTMDLNYSTRSHCEDLGQIGTNQMGTRSKGLKMHSALAVNNRGVPLGVLRVQTWAPQPADKNTHRNDLPIEEKDSFRWLQIYQDALTVAVRIPQTHVICVGDRESDIFELFDERRKHGGRVDILARVQHNRCLDGQEEKLFDYIRHGEADGAVSIAVPRQREKSGKPSEAGRSALPARTAQVDVRFREVTICAPQTPRLKDKKPIRLFIVSLFEKDPPLGATRIEWLLLTTIEVHSLKQALKCVKWYCQRWRIEEWHRVLKSGCRILEHQNHSAKVLARTLTLDAVIAWRIMVLALLGREIPEMPCTLMFNPLECEVLQLLSQKKSPSHSVTPSSSSPNLEAT